MWYEILPSFFMFAGFMSLPFIVVPTINYIGYGKPMIREATTNMDKQYLRRDNCLDPTGRMDCNHTVYWEGIPDAKE